MDFGRGHTFENFLFYKQCHHVMNPFKPEHTARAKIDFFLCTPISLTEQSRMISLRINRYSFEQRKSVYIPLLFSTKAMNF